LLGFFNEDFNAVVGSSVRLVHWAHTGNLYNYMHICSVLVGDSLEIYSSPANNTSDAQRSLSNRKEKNQKYRAK
jgi:hypothetical protein